jgi:hypothetical protein
MLVFGVFEVVWDVFLQQAGEKRGCKRDSILTSRPGQKGKQRFEATDNGMRASNEL